MKTALRILIVLLVLAGSLMSVVPAKPAQAGVDLYAVLLTGNNLWSATTTWSTTANGLGVPAGPPGVGDNVYISAICQAGATLTVDATASCLDMDWTGAANTPDFKFSASLNIYGNATFIAAMTTSRTAGYFCPKSAVEKTLTTNGLTINFPIYPSANASFKLLDNLTQGGSVGIFMSPGVTFNTNGKTVTCAVLGDAGDAGAKTLTLGSSIINVNGNYNFDAGGLVLTANTATLNVTGNFYGGGVTTYYIVNLTGATSTVKGSNTFAQLNLVGGTTQTITFTAGTTQTITTPTLSGTSGHVHTLTGSGTWNIAKAGGGTVAGDYLSITNSAASPASTWYAGTHSTNGGGNSGWTFGGPPPAAPTGVSATDGTSTSNVTVTWNASTYATDYYVLRDAVSLGAVGNVLTYDDTEAASPTITPGSANATDGTYVAYVSISVSGQSSNNGTAHSYTVIASNSSGNSSASGADTGYRGVGSLTYQWLRSAADSDASYSSIVGATTASYNDTGAPSDGSGRYYKLTLSATGASTQNSTADRGYRIGPPSAPTNFTAVTGNNITLSWTMWPTATTTIILMGHIQYPASITDGTLVYSGNGSSVDVGSYDSSEDFFFTAWSQNGAGYSVDSATTELESTSMAEITAQITAFNGYVSQAVQYFWALGVLIPLVAFSILAFRHPKGIFFVMTGALAFITGLEYRHIMQNEIGLAVSLSLLIYWLVCWGFAFLYIWKYDFVISVEYHAE